MTDTAKVTEIVPDHDELPIDVRAFNLVPSLSDREQPSPNSKGIQKYAATTLDRAQPETGSTDRTLQALRGRRSQR